MSRLLLLTLLISGLAACKTKANGGPSTIELKKQYDYRIAVDIWNAFSGEKSTYILDNRRIGLYDSIDARNNRLKPLTLYRITYMQKAVDSTESQLWFVPSDTLHLAFSKSQSDTLFELTRAFFQSMRLNNLDTAVNGVVTKPVILDDSKARIVIDFDGNALSATIGSISNPSIITPEFNRLLHYLQEFSIPGSSNGR